MRSVGVTESTRMRAAAHALAQALESLAEALAHGRAEQIAASEAALEAGTMGFRAAVADATACGNTEASQMATVVGTALARCRRLGASLSLLAGPTEFFPDAPKGYTPVGQPRGSTDGVSFLTARG